MAGKVFFSVTMSLDGFMAPDAVPVEQVFSPEGRNDPNVQRWMTKWSELQAWAFPLRWFRENLKLGEGGEEGLDNDIARATYERTGASVMGKRMFDAGELAWPEEAPFHTPVFVVTHTRREPWERPGGTTFHFVNDGISSALDQAREAAGDGADLGLDEEQRGTARVAGVAQGGKWAVAGAERASERTCPSCLTVVP